MEDLFSIELPKTVSDIELEALEGEIKQLNDIADAGVEDTRSIDPATLGIWIQLATGVLGVVGTALPIIRQIIEMIRGKGIKGAKIILDENTTISVDEVSAKDLESVLKALKQQ